MDQRDFPFALDQAKLKDFLERYTAMEDEQDRLREEVRLLKEDYKDDMPLRAVLTAVKIVRARAKLAAHQKESMAPVHLAYLEELVDRYLSGVMQAAEALMQELEGTTVTMTAGKEQE